MLRGYRGKRLRVRLQPLSFKSSTQAPRNNVHRKVSFEGYPSRGSPIRSAPPTPIFIRHLRSAPPTPIFIRHLLPRPPILYPSYSYCTCQPPNQPLLIILLEDFDRRESPLAHETPSVSDVPNQTPRLVAPHHTHASYHYPTKTMKFPSTQPSIQQDNTKDTPPPANNLQPSWLLPHGPRRTFKPQTLHSFATQLMYWSLALAFSHERPWL